MNAFSAKPDISKFIKDVKHSHHSSKLGRQMAENPTPEQRYLFDSKRKTATETIQPRNREINKEEQ